MAVRYTAQKMVTAADRGVAADLIGHTPEIEELRARIRVVAPSTAKVLVSGESGVGKELVSRAVHAQSRRAEGPFVPVNCAGMPESLLETELFGHLKGSFTGAYRDKCGMLEFADGGTVFLDEIGEMTVRMQGLLLRFLETGELRKVGDTLPTGRVDVRVVAATNSDLRQMVSQKTFREDLFYRLDVIHLTVPPLRQRKQDIPLLIDHFLERFATANASVVRRIAPDALMRLVEYSWPGNVRELENVIESLVIRTPTAIATVDDLPGTVLTPAALHDDDQPAPDSRLATELYRRVVHQGKSFWALVHPLFMRRDITTRDVRDVVRQGLTQTHGSYTQLTRLFNMQPIDYKRFMTFLRKHDCHVPFQAFR